MKILHIDTERTWRGGEQQVANLIHGLFARGHEMLLSAPPGSEILQRIPDSVCGKYPVPFHGEFDLLSALRLSRIIQVEKPDILHAHTANAHTFGWLAKRNSFVKTPLVVHRRVDFPVKSHLLNRIKYKQADCYITVSLAIAGILEEYGIPAKKIRTVHSSFDVNRFQNADGDKIRHEFGLSSSDVLIGTIAICEDRKSQDILLEAASIICKSRMQAHFFIVGDGPSLEKLKRMAVETGLTSNVHFPGFRNDTGDFLKAFDVFVLIPKMEGLGSAILEAESMSLPIVATPVGGIPEIVRDRENAFFVPVGDVQVLAEALIRLIDSPELRMEMGKKSYQLLVDSFTSDKMVDKTLKVYEELLEKQG